MENQNKIVDTTNIAVSLSNLIPHGRKVERKDINKFVADYKIRTAAEEKIQANKKPETKKEKKEDDK